MTSNSSDMHASPVPQPRGSYEGYDRLLDLVPYLNLLNQLVRAAGIQDGMRVLDLACGTGNLLVALQQLGIICEVVGLDASEEAVGVARSKACRYEEHLGTASIHVADLNGPVEDWPATTSDVGEFDAVVCNNFLYASRDPKAVLDKAAVLTKPGGLLAFSSPMTAPDMEAVYNEHANLCAPTPGPERDSERRHIVEYLAPIVPANKDLLADPSLHFVGMDTQRGWADPAYWRVDGMAQAYGLPAQNSLVTLRRLQS